jgi:hypothetical protein
LATIRKINVTAHSIAIQEALDKKLSPDVALKEILRESGKEPTDKGYPQMALDIAFGIWRAYQDAGNMALPNFRAAITNAQGNTLARIAPQITAVAQNVTEPEGVKELLIGQQQRMDSLMLKSEVAQAGGTGMAPLSPLLKSRAFTEMGLPPVFKDMSAEEIKTTVLLNLMDKNRGNPQVVADLTDQLNPVSRNPEIDRMLDMVPPLWWKGQKSLQEEFAKKDAERKKVADENLKNNLVTAWDNEGKPVTFEQTPEGLANAEAYRKAPAFEKVAIAKNEEARRQHALASTIGNKRFQERPITEQNDIRDDIDLAKIYLESGQEFASPETAPLLEKYGATTLDELKVVINEVAKMNGLPGIPEPQEENEPPGIVEKALDWLRTPTQHIVNAIIGRPQVGEIKKGYRFRGGDPAQPSSWEKVQ